jgi:hypothetical protein
VITNLVLIAAVVLAVVILKKRGVALPIAPVVNPAAPIVDNPALNTILQGILAKLLDNKQLLDWEHLLAGHFAEDLVGVVPGLARILQTHGLMPAPKPAPAKPA